MNADVRILEHLTQGMPRRLGMPTGYREPML